MIVTKQTVGLHSQNMLSRNAMRADSFDSSLGSNSLQNSTASLPPMPKLNQKYFYIAKDKFTSGYHQDILAKLGNSATSVPPSGVSKLTEFERKIDDANSLLLQLNVHSLFGENVIDGKIESNFIAIKNITQALDRLIYSQ